MAKTAPALSTFLATIFISRFLKSAGSEVDSSLIFRAGARSIKRFVKSHTAGRLEVQYRSISPSMFKRNINIVALISAAENIFPQSQDSSDG